MVPVEYVITDVADPFTGQKLAGKYFVLDRVGSGAMSVVYKARQDPIDRIVAIKLLKKEWSNDPVTVKRFQREAKAVSTLRHKNIPAIMDIGTADTGQPFFVTELIEGTSLEQCLESGDLIEPERAVRIFMQVCDALSHAHKQGLIHRDIKPGNIMIVDENGIEQVKLVDFGIVKYAKSQAASQQLTQKGEIWGSPVYMSPEQCAGNDLDHRTDIYSLGTVMYEVLTGKQAFDGKNIPAILVKQLNEMPAEFSVAAPDRSCPKKLEDVVFRTLQKSAEKRYQSMEECKLALEEVLKEFERARRRISGTIAAPPKPFSQSLQGVKLSTTETKPGPPAVSTTGETARTASREAEPPHTDITANKSLKLIIAILCLLIVGSGIAIGVFIGWNHNPTSTQRVPGKPP
ncbi:MAG: serine/threonine protein kinase [Candidatus Obscuribacterales bacterium]|nr:serine/threonine protein kinase [Candidatus Obscuribacterales bacterium]